MSNTEFTKVLLSEMRALLKPLGYLKKGMIFHRDKLEIIHLVGLQKSMDSTGQAIKVTVNLAIWVKSLAPIRAGRPDTPSVWDAQWRERIGFLMQERHDKWWWITSEAEAETTAKEICLALDKFALPKLNEIQTEHDLVSLWRNGICTGLTDFAGERYLAKIDARE